MPELKKEDEDSSEPNQKLEESTGTSQVSNKPNQKLEREAGTSQVPKEPSETQSTSQQSVQQPPTVPVATPPPAFKPHNSSELESDASAILENLKDRNNHESLNNQSLVYEEEDNKVSSIATYIEQMTKVPTKEEMINNLPGCYPKVKGCHIYKECYDYIKSLYHPLACPSAVVAPKEATDCMTRNPIVIVGDSRSREVATGLTQILPSEELSFETVRWDPHQFHRDIVAAISVHGDEGASALSFFWNPQLRPMEKEFGDLDSSGAKNLTLMIGGVGAHIVAEPSVHDYFFDRLAILEKNMKELLKQVKYYFDQGMFQEVIYMKDSDPLRLPFESMHKTYSTHFVNDLAEKLLQNYPFIKKWDSHQYIALEHNHICGSVLMPGMGPQSRLKTGAQQLDVPFKCPDTWHKGFVYEVK